MKTLATYQQEMGEVLDKALGGDYDYRSLRKESDDLISRTFSEIEQEVAGEFRGYKDLYHQIRKIFARIRGDEKKCPSGYPDREGVWVKSLGDYHDPKCSVFDKGMFDENKVCNCRPSEEKYAYLSHEHCWNQRQPSACSIPLEKHKQCCLCDLKPN